MKTIAQIEEEYKDYKAKTQVVKNLDEFLTYIEIGIDDTEEYQRDYEKELKENKRWALEAKVRNCFFFIFQEEDVDFYEEDDKILEACISYTREFGEFYRKIQSIATKENFEELLKLVDFSTEYYSNQMDYYDYLRDKLETIMKGFQLFNPNYEDSREAFTEFMQKQLLKLGVNSPKEKGSQYVKR